MAGIGAPELIIVLVVVLLIFGSTRLPKLARSMGEASKEFKKGVQEDADDKKDQDPPAATPPAGQRAVTAPGDSVTMTQAELDALLAQREAEARRNAPPSS